MAEGREYCRNCSHNSIQFASRTMMFVKTCRITLRILWQNSTFCYLHTVSKSKWHKTFKHWSGILCQSPFTDADKKVCQFVIHPLPFILYVAEVQTCRCDALSRVLWHFAILCEYFCTQKHRRLKWHSVTLCRWGECYSYHGVNHTCALLAAHFWAGWFGFPNLGNQSLL